MAEETSIENCATGVRSILSGSVTREYEQDNQVRLGGQFPLLPRPSDPGKFDPTMSWLTLERRDMEIWRDFAHRWLSKLASEHIASSLAKGLKLTDIKPGRIVSNKGPALHSFLVDYLQDKQYPDRIFFIQDPFALLRTDSRVADDFWQSCCLPIMQTRRVGGKTLQYGVAASKRSHDIHAFLTWIIATKGTKSELDARAFRSPFTPRSQCGMPSIRQRKSHDMELSWVARDCPHLEAWRILGAQWIQQEKDGIATKLVALIKFIGSYLVDPNLVEVQVAVDPMVFLHKRSQVPDNFKTLVPPRSPSVNDHIVTFLDWILLHSCSESDDYGHAVLSGEFRNPFKKMGSRGEPGTGESVRSPLPYGFIDELRRMLVQGPNFRDWTWAQESLGGAKSPTGWFPVDETMIDKNDPDCVWRIREAKSRRNYVSTSKHEMWSPVRWVALLTKLTLPLRTSQVRVLDSGEADTWQYDGSASSDTHNVSAWKLNESNSKLRAAVSHARSAEQPSHQVSSRHKSSRMAREHGLGVFRRRVEMVTEKSGVVSRETTVLHINTNKTADRLKEGAAKGFDIPWPVLPWPISTESAENTEKRLKMTPLELYRDGGELARNLHYWLQKLRDWQTKYNPVHKATSWEELVAHSIVGAKSEEQIEAHGAAVFLFREPAYPGVQGRSRRTEIGHLPLTDRAVYYAWWTMLRTLQESLAKRGYAAPDGSPVKLITDDTHEVRTTQFPLHSLRVSLITALALDGGMSLPLLQKVVGHSRLLMTLYYVKPNAAHVMQELDQAHARLSALDEQDIQKFLASASIEQLRDRAVFNDEKSAFAALGQDSKVRNPAGWLPMHHGVCPMGGNTDVVTENKRVGGCHNGGEPLGSHGGGDQVYGPVPGGVRNCIRCRWFITEPRYVPALVVHCNSLSFYFEQAQTLAIRRTDELEQLKDKIYDVERTDASQAAPLRIELLGYQRRFESTLKDLQDAAQSMTACYRLVQRCISIARERKLSGADNDGGMALIANGTEAEWEIIVEGTDSELLQLCGILENAEIYPDLNPGEAILRRSQLLDAALVRDGFEPRFFTLSKEEQHLLGNEFVRRIGHECDPSDAPMGRREAVAMLENESVGVSTQLGKTRQYFAELIPALTKPRPVFPIHKRPGLQS